MTADELADLLRRIGRYLQEANLDLEWRFQPDHPATLLREAEDALDEIGRATGLIRLPPPVRRRT